MKTIETFSGQTKMEVGEETDFDGDLYMKVGDESFYVTRAGMVALRDHLDAILDDKKDGGPGLANGQRVTVLGTDPSHYLDAGTEAVVTNAGLGVGGAIVEVEGYSTHFGTKTLQWVKSCDLKPIEDPAPTPVAGVATVTIRPEWDLSGVANALADLVATLHAAGV